MKLLHLKNVATDGAMTDVGAGTLDFPAMIAAGVEHFSVAHDIAPKPHWPSVETSVGYLRTLAQPGDRQRKRRRTAPGQLAGVRQKRKDVIMNSTRELPPLKIGAIGAARITPQALVAAARETGVAEVTMVAARDSARATEYAAAHGIPAVAKDYDALIDDDRVEAIYIALPPSHHAPYVIRALEAGKPVLCEKPMSANLEDAQAMAAASARTGVLLMEAFHYRYHPLIARVHELVAAGEIGDLQEVRIRFVASFPETPEELRYRPELGGGALGDLGTYCLHFCRALVGEEPIVMEASRQIGPTGVDLATTAALMFPGGVRGHLHCDMVGEMQAVADLVGSRGTMKIYNPIAPQYGHAILIGDRQTKVTTEPTYNFQLRAFASAARGGAGCVTDAREALAHAQVLDAIRRKAQPDTAPAEVRTEVGERR